MMFSAICYDCSSKSAIKNKLFHMVTGTESCAHSVWSPDMKHLYVEMFIASLLFEKKPCFSRVVKNGRFALRVILRKRSWSH